MKLVRPAALLAPVFVLGALALSACAIPGFGPSTSEPPPPAPAPEYPATIRPEELVGKWGYAAYHREEDRARIEGAARGACSKPVNITRGPTGGIMMYLADQNQLQELRVKGGPGGKNYIGPPGEAGGPQDREIISFDGRVLITKFVDPEVAGRYGTSVYVRCGPKA
jgi:hypothetical protein